MLGFVLAILTVWYLALTPTVIIALMCCAARDKE
jgi:hypothetical protein